MRHADELRLRVFRRRVINNMCHLLGFVWIVIKCKHAMENS
jgi:hypothetical protein